MGDSGLTVDQAKAQFAVWSIFAAVSNLLIRLCGTCHKILLNSCYVAPILKITQWDSIAITMRCKFQDSYTNNLLIERIFL